MDNGRSKYSTQVVDYIHLIAKECAWRGAQGMGYSLAPTFGPTACFSLGSLGPARPAVNMDVFKLAFETTIVGLLALPWCIRQLGLDRISLCEERDRCVLCTMNCLS